ncbi:hypothetical protein ACIQC9_03805 [Brevundimonas sp. NPDC092305]|uniref:hypothetical protein n=1 Tax=Brevundimonas sp. NPDC092305 TaxID=3363957 RepID=UPI0037F1F5E1
MRFLTLGVAAALLLPAWTVSAQTPPEDDPASLDDVVVYGGAPAERARQFVHEVSRPPFGRALARWTAPICIGVANLQPDAAQALIDRIASVAASLGLEPAEPGCKPHILIVAAHASDADALVDKFVSEDEYQLRPSRGGTDLGSQALEAFRESRAPVRWWHVSLPVMAETGQPALLLDGDTPTPPPTGDTPPMYMVMVPSMSRISQPVRNDLMRAIIVVDVDQTRSVSFASLADYLSMVALAQINPAVEVGSADSILNLFNADASRATKMTDWDAAFLVSLYESRSNPMSSAQQANEMARDMIRAVGDGG